MSAVTELVFPDWFPVPEQLVKAPRTLGMLPNETYHAQTGWLSHSQLVELAKPGGKARYMAMLTAPKVETAALRFGQLAHRHVLEGINLDELVSPYDSFRTKEAKQWRVDHPDYITQAQAVQLAGMKTALLGSPFIEQLLSDGHSEVSWFWEDTGYTKDGAPIPCKARPDWLPNLELDGHPVIVDYKTTVDATVRGFTGAVVRFGYDQQAAWYLNGYRTVSGVDADPVFIFIAQEKEPPYLCAAYRLDTALIRHGEVKNLIAVNNWLDGLEHGFEQGLDSSLVTVEAPGWVEYETAELEMEADR